MPWVRSGPAAPSDFSLIVFSSDRRMRGQHVNWTACERKGSRAVKPTLRPAVLVRPLAPLMPALTESQQDDLTHHLSRRASAALREAIVLGLSSFSRSRNILTPSL